MLEINYCCTFHGHFKGFKTMTSSMKMKDIGSKGASGETRYGVHLKMKVITSNAFDIKISAKYPDGDLLFLNQKDLRRKEAQL